MKTLQIIVVIALAAVILALAGCGKLSNPLSPSLKSGTSASPSAAARAPVTAAYTDEDWKLIRMPYEERLAYLEKRFKELVYEFHGIVIEKTLVGGKAAR